MLNAGHEDITHWSWDAIVRLGSHRDREKERERGRIRELLPAINYATKLLYKRRVSNTEAKGRNWPSAKARRAEPLKVVKQIMAWHRNIWNSCHMYMRDWRQLQELENSEEGWSGNCTRTAAGPKLSPSIQLQSVVFFYCCLGLFMSIVTVKTLWRHFSHRDKCADKRFCINSIVQLSRKKEMRKDSQLEILLTGFAWEKHFASEFEHTYCKLNRIILNP